MLTIPGWEHAGDPTYPIELNCLVDLRLAGTFDITSRVINWGHIRTGVKRISKIPEISGVTLTLDNTSGEFNVIGNAFGSDLSYLNSEVLISLGIRSQGHLQVQPFYRGLLKSLVEIGNRKALMVIQDPISDLKNRSAAVFEGDQFTSVAPAEAAALILGFAGFGAWIDSSFSLQALYERAAGEVITYTITSGTFWSNTVTIMESSKANIRYTGGFFNYYRRLPILGGGGPNTLTDNLILSGERAVKSASTIQHIENHLTIFNNTINLTGSSPITDQPSIDTFGALTGDRNYIFDTDPPALAAGEEEVDLLKSPSLNFELELDMRAAIAQPGDRFNLESDEFGDQIALVEDVDVVFDSRKVNLAMSKDTTSDQWLITDDGDLLDNGEEIW